LENYLTQLDCLGFSAWFASFRVLSLPFNARFLPFEGAAASSPRKSRNPQEPSSLPNWKTKTQAKPNLPPRKPPRPKPTITPTYDQHGKSHPARLFCCRIVGHNGLMTAETEDSDLPEALGPAWLPNMVSGRDTFDVSSAIPPPLFVIVSLPPKIIVYTKS
jgi:hypothetical protein